MIAFWLGILTLATIFVLLIVCALCSSLRHIQATLEKHDQYFAHLMREHEVLRALHVEWKARVVN